MKNSATKIHIYPTEEYSYSSGCDSLWWQVDRIPTPKDENEKQLLELEVSSVYISRGVARTMVSLFRRHPIRRLTLRTCEVWPDVLEKLFQECSSLEELTLHRVTKLNQKCTRLITYQLSNLRSLTIHYKPQADNHSFSILLRRIHKLQHLETLRLDGSPLSQKEYVNALLNSLQAPGALPRLRVLSFKSCLLSDESVAQLLATISDNETLLPSLTTIDLSINCCYEKGIGALAMLLESPSCRLERLELMCQVPRKEGSLPVEPLFWALHTNHSLKELRLSGNFLRDVYLLGDFLTVNSGLEVLDLCGNSLNESDLRQLSRGLSQNRTLKSLNLKSNHFSSLEPLDLSANDTLCQLSHSCRGPLAQRVAFLCKLNTAGRRLVRQISAHSGLWPLVMERCNDNVDALYFFVQNSPTQGTNHPTSSIV